MMECVIMMVLACAQMPSPEISANMVYLHPVSVTRVAAMEEAALNPTCVCVQVDGREVIVKEPSASQDV
jgi:hypothetical protein